LVFDCLFGYGSLTPISQYFSYIVAVSFIYCGIQGLTGSRGQQGSKGEIGQAGKDGVNGSPGQKGERGLQGIPGSKVRLFALNIMTVELSLPRSYGI
jgi:hypothetical protein